MRTTTVTWRKPADYTAEQQKIDNAKVEGAAVELAGEDHRTYIAEIPSGDPELVIYKRQWPDLATAQAWVDFVLSCNGAVSAEVDPE